MVQIPRSRYFVCVFFLSFPPTQSTSMHPCTCFKQPRLAILGVAGDTRQAEATEYARPDASSSMLQTLGCLGFQTLKHALKYLTHARAYSSLARARHSSQLERQKRFAMLCLSPMQLQILTNTRLEPEIQTQPVLP